MSGLGVAHGGRAASHASVVARQGLAFLGIAELTGRSVHASYPRLAALAADTYSCFLLSVTLTSF